MLVFGSLISGSSGNATIISDGETTLLTDCGMSGKGLAAALDNIGIPVDSISGVLVTHEHSDHVKGIGVIARRYGFKVYASDGTLSSMTDCKINDDLLVPICADKDFQIGTIGIKPFSIPHDAAEPLGFSYFADDQKVSLATDIGEVNDYIYDNIKGSSTVLLESNHDVEMLRYGSYPYYLKQRILSNHGHLSNENAAKTAVRLAESGTEHLLLGHLSRENNLPDIAYMTTANALKNNDITEADIDLKVADRYSPTIIRV